MLVTYEHFVNTGHVFRRPHLEKRQLSGMNDISCNDLTKQLDLHKMFFLKFALRFISLSIE